MNWEEKIEANRNEYLEKENELLRGKLAHEQKVFDLLEKSVDQSRDSSLILRRFHRELRQYKDSISEEQSIVGYVGSLTPKGE